MQVHRAAIAMLCSGMMTAGWSLAAADPDVPGFVVDVYATVDLPMRLSFDEQGNLFVGNNTTYPNPASIVRIGLGGVPVEAYGPPLLDPDAVVVHDPNSSIPAADGSILVAGVFDASRGHITEVRADQTAQELFLPGVAYFNPSCLEFDSQGRLLFTDFYANVVFVSTGGDPVPLVSVPDDPDAMAIDSLDRIFVRSGDGVIRIFDSGGALVDDSFATGIGGATGMAFGPGGVWGHDLYMIANGELVRFDPSGAATVIGTGFSDGSVGFPDVEFGPDNALYASDYHLDRILRIAPSEVAVHSQETPQAMTRLLQNTPNPFHPRTQVALTLARSGFVEVDVYDVTGRLIRHLQASDLAAGSHAFTWNGDGQDGSPVASGTYFYQLKLDGLPVETKKAVLQGR